MIGKIRNPIETFGFIIDYLLITYRLPIDYLSQLAPQGSCLIRVVIFEPQVCVVIDDVHGVVPWPSHIPWPLRMSDAVPVEPRAKRCAEDGRILDDSYLVCTGKRSKLN